MSKLARTLQSAAARTNWEDTVKMLFWADMDSGRSAEIRKLNSFQIRPPKDAAAESYSSEQFQFVLLLMMITSIVEKRTQVVYKEEFADRCDAIARSHGLHDDQSWNVGDAPAEWEALNREFEDRSLGILKDTLREYKQDDLAKLVETDGGDQFFDIVDNVRTQFFKVLVNPRLAGESASAAKEGSIPESLQHRRSKKIL